MESSAGWRRVSCGARRAAVCWRVGGGRGRGRCAGRTGRCELCPRRSRCTGCGVTHVLLPVSALLRRADTAAVIVSALAAKARCGLGFRRIAADAGPPGGDGARLVAALRRAGRGGAVGVHRVVARGGSGSGDARAGRRGVRRCGDGDRRGRDRDRAPVRAAHGVAGRDRGRGLGWPVVGAGLARSGGCNTSRPCRW